jgi:hypothetical protein
MEDRAMNSKEEWVKLQQHTIPEGQFVVTSFIQNLDGVRIILDDEESAVEIFFDGVPSLIRIAPEGVRMRTWGEIQLKSLLSKTAKPWGMRH